MNVNIGIIGPGNIADRRLAPALTQTKCATFWSVCSRDSKKARAFGEKHGARAATFAYSDLEVMLKDPDLHAVIVALPDALHAKAALLAADYRKHVLLEKPMCTNVIDARRLVQRFNEQELKLAVGYHLRWHACHLRIKQELEAETLGQILHANFSGLSLEMRQTGDRVEVAAAGGP